MTTLDTLRSIAQTDPPPEKSITRREVDMVTLSDVKPEELRWLWRRRILRGGVTLLAGDPGAGKSFATLAIAKAVTNGEALPDSDAHEPSDVIMWNGEDGIADTIRVRADALGVDSTRVQVIRGMTDGRGRQLPFALSDVDRIHKSVEDNPRVALLIIDPLAALLGAVDTHRDANLRSALSPLAKIARDTGIAVLCVLHLRKSEAQRPLHAVGGSIGFVGLARSVLLAGRNPTDGRRAIVSLKSNNSAPPAAIEYFVDDEGRWRWGDLDGTVDAYQLLAPARPQKTVQNEAANAIIAALKDGEMTAEQLATAIEDTGISPRSFERARATLKQEGKIATRRDGFGADSRVVWRITD